MISHVTKHEFPMEGNKKNNSSPNGRFFSSAVVYNGCLYNFGGTHDHGDEYDDLWKVKSSCLISSLTLLYKNGLNCPSEPHHRLPHVAMPTQSFITMK